MEKPKYNSMSDANTVASNSIQCYLHTHHILTEPDEVGEVGEHYNPTALV